MAIHASGRAALPPESAVLVFGAGAVGLLAAAMAKIKGASDVVIADIDQGRVDFAVQNGFAHAGFTVPMMRGESIEKNLEIAKETATSICRVKRRSGAEIGEADAVFECTGVPSCVQAAIYVSTKRVYSSTLTDYLEATRAGGKVMLVGMGTPVYTLPVSAAALREVDIVGVFRYANTYAEGIDIVSRQDPNAPDFSKLVTHRYNGLDGIEQAFQMAGETKDEQGKLVLKVVVEMSENEQT